MQHRVLDDESLVVEFFHDEIVVRGVDFEDDGFDRGVAFNKDAWYERMAR